jgi:hypothetical protein
MVEGVHASVGAIQRMEEACVRFARVMIDRLPEIAFELRRVSEALEERYVELRKEIALLEEETSSADEDEDVSWARSRLAEAEDKLASVQRRRRKFAEASTAYMAHAGKAEHLSTAHTIKATEFLREAADDLRAYFSHNIDGGSPTGIQLDTKALLPNELIKGGVSGPIAGPAGKAMFPVTEQQATAGTIRHVNPDPSPLNLNCVNCVIASEYRFRGIPAVAEVSRTPLSIGSISTEFGGEWRCASGPIEIGSLLSTSGEGSTGAVFGRGADGMNHVWNARFDKGMVRFLDGQSGGLGLNNFDNFTDFMFLPLRPGQGQKRSL